MEDNTNQDDSQVEVNQPAAQDQLEAQTEPSQPAVDSQPPLQPQPPVQSPSKSIGKRLLLPLIFLAVVLTVAVGVFMVMRSNANMTTFTGNGYVISYPASDDFTVDKANDGVTIANKENNARVQVQKRSISYSDSEKQQIIEKFKKDMSKDDVSSALGGMAIDSFTKEYKDNQNVHTLQITAEIANPENTAEKGKLAYVEVLDWDENNYYTVMISAKESNPDFISQISKIMNSFALK